MDEKLLFLVCLLISFVGLAITSLVLLFHVKKEWRSGKLFKGTRGFIISNLFFGTIYLVFYYREYVLKDYNMSLLLRLLDYTICILVLFFWIRLMAALIPEDFSVKLMIAAKMITGVRLLFCYCSSALLMDEAHFIADQGWRSFYMIADIILVLFFVGVIVVGAVHGLENNSELLISGFIIIMSLLFILFDLDQMIMGSELSFGQYRFAVWKMGIFDPVVCLIFFVNLGAVIFLLYMDFSPVYSREKGGTQQRGLDFLAEQRALTVLEQSILVMRYEGYNNADIGRNFGISERKVRRSIGRLLVKFDALELTEVYHMTDKNFIKREE